MTHETATFLLTLIDSLTVQVGPNFAEDSAKILAARTEVAAFLTEG